ncbi:hypothetical protein B0H63DRAFT_204654 [Podospora didyma]|uniref:Mating-type switching protein swi10 n=1 Tax=Podospora didyma TaxID=330526 RepID=A0AAE0NH95_9PEZI|nr:hypothetical protein B0H63DRAFT_204654 [Podospora didyma]
MERTKARPLAEPQPVAAKTPVPRLRRKLQKSVTRQVKSTVTKRLGSGASNEADGGNKNDTKNKLSTQARPCLPLALPSPDLSDSKWTEFFRGSGCLSGQDSPAQSKECLKSPVNIIPEFSHLVVHDAQPRSSLSSSDSPASSTSTAMRRRRAKTPIYSIYQLDDMPRPSNALSKTPSIELIAEQYRALLDSRNSAWCDSQPDLPLPSQSSSGSGSDSDGQQLQAEAPIHKRDQPTELPSASSPISSDDETLVAFEEERVYFKPVSFSPEPMLSPVQFEHHLHPLRSPTPAAAAPDNLSLQICLDLLTRELSSALSKRPNRSSPETSALQVWVMIEAYERLRDQLSEAPRLRNEELRTMENMFDMWLRALYTIHDNLTGDGRASESDYEAELRTEDLD